jgi:hypothetical protein
LELNRDAAKVDDRTAASGIEARASLLNSRLVHVVDFRQQTRAGGGKVRPALSRQILEQQLQPKLHLAGRRIRCGRSNRANPLSPRSASFTARSSSAMIVDASGTSMLPVSRPEIGPFSS